MKKLSLVSLVGAMSLLMSAPTMAEEVASGKSKIKLESSAKTSESSGEQSMPAPQELPGPIKALEREGLTFHETFEVGGDLTGYAMSMQGQPVPVFVTADGKRAVIGSMIDSQGEDLVQDRLDSIVMAPLNEAAWDILEDAQTVVEGADDAPNMMYTVTDPNCGYCHRLWQSSKPLVDAGKLQVHHIMVGIQGADSPAKAAAIAQADDPAAAMEQHQMSFSEGGITPAEQIEAGSQEMLDMGMALMEAANVRGTPASFYKDAEGNVRRIGGAVSTGTLVEMLGIEN